MKLLTNQPKQNRKLKQPNNLLILRCQRNDKLVVRGVFASQMKMTHKTNCSCRLHFLLYTPRGKMRNNVLQQFGKKKKTYTSGICWCHPPLYSLKHTHTLTLIFVDPIINVKICHDANKYRRRMVLIACTTITTIPTTNPAHATNMLQPYHDKGRCMAVDITKCFTKRNE